MSRTHKNKQLAVLFIAVTLALGISSVGAKERSSATRGPIGGEAVSMARFYVGTHGNIGTFPGTLVRVSCDVGHVPRRHLECQADGHRHALSMDDGSMIHPLVSGTEEVLKEINSTELHGKKVVVHGKYYPSTGFIFVNQVTPAQ